MATWESEDLDLDGLLTHIGYRGDLSPTPETLAALHRAYTTSIPFENLEIMLDRPVLLDVKSLQDKLIRHRRGGYCFEHATLFAAMLEALGFRFSAVLGRVTMGGDAARRPATHALLVVEFDDGRRVLCDVGFGRGPLEPIPVEDGVEVVQDGWRLRLTRTSSEGPTGIHDEWTMWQQQADPDGTPAWVDRHVWTLEPVHPIDFAVGNHYVSTSSRSPFTMRPFVQRFHADRQDTLDGRTWTTVAPDGRVLAQRDVEIGEIPRLLADVFDIELGAPDTAALLESLSRLPAMRVDAVAR
ncbi:arylamine N-acetyltransferase [Gordonia araii NBRC 100433]|uniref:Arylamine N-acetyltransferase n=1 Tax=Gordonia araii NBRC 100433 TaxID=1073574 RepID=G7H0T2_9ACTN|nr:arylamine N-acetyltransferase [Gordonia araii]NNG99205.1 arylamine N-acetyltransferase [Gordonia araii NBRC 100433]GAB09457.1 arylamine N-acetyltransferase [Gordonia araii NBRC 100433]